MAQWGLESTFIHRCQNEGAPIWAKSSPSCANFAPRKCALNNKDSQDAVDKVLHCFYIDDCLMSVTSEEEAVSLYHDLIFICAKGEFQLTKWISNRREVMAAKPENHRAKNMKGLDLDDLDDVSSWRVFGVEWCIHSDAFKIIIKDRQLTRQGILLTISSIYYPLGFLSPIVLTAKKILMICVKEHPAGVTRYLYRLQRNGYAGWKNFVIWRILTS